MIRALLIAILLLPASSLAAKLPASVLAALKAANIPESDLGVFVQDISRTAPVLTSSPDRPMNPASTMKLVTTYAALRMLGPDYHFKTEAYVDGPIENGSLHGNLILKGYGDPKLTIENLWLFLRQLRQKGLAEIKGELIFDRSWFARQDLDPGEFDHKPFRPYNTLPDALLINFQSINIGFSAEAASVKVTLDPDLGLIRVQNGLRLGQGPCNGWDEALTEQVEAEGRQFKLTLQGEFPAACGEKSDAISLPEHADYDYRLFRMIWTELGGKIDGGFREGSVPANALLYATHQSPPLAQILYDINKYSNNLMARQVFLTLGAGNSPATTQQAALEVKSWLGQNRLPFPELVLENGCGLSRNEQISARHLGMLLIDAYRSPVMPEWVASLPIIGVDGTMKKRLNDSQAAGRAHVKSGYLEGVRAVAGFVLSKTGRTFAVVGIVNGPRARESKAALDALIEWTEEFN